MAELQINGKKVKSISMKGKNLTKMEMNGHTYTFISSPGLQGNSFTGRFSYSGKENDFMAITDTVRSDSFIWEYDLKGIKLPDTINIGDNAFADSPLTEIYIPKATTIGRSVFISIVNNSSTKVTMLSKFNSDAEKNRIFSAGHWNNITFTWV